MTSYRLLYSYDADGNMTGKISKSSGDTTSFTRDIENKLVEVRKPGLLVQYEYDATGRRVTKNVNPDGIGTGSITTQFRYDGDDLILEMNDSDSIVANYTFGPGIDDPIAMHRDNKNYYYVKDGLGSVRALTDSIGNTVKEYKYSVFGKITEESRDSNLWNPFTYTSREWEKEMGIYFYRARYFDPEIGRFLSEDLLFALNRSNLFYYCNNNPLNLSDAMGLDPGDIFLTQDEAALDAINYINRKSINYGKEYGGWINENNGTFTYTTPVSGTKAGVDIGPKSNNSAAYYHTHGSNDPEYNNEDFSGKFGDIDFADKNGVDAYLGTPNGFSKKYDHNTETTSSIGFNPSQTTKWATPDATGTSSAKEGRFGYCE